ncbi:MAG: 1-deoxy-D-xylulose 5-phosphate reductoisomerase [Dehalococcoides mccartyi]|uniref:1-deoxy-D-xylulose-5-phosphate reductoisomerase n=1 Tax=Dehalococcoides mccartyi TaxID=61435 RepID=UPI0024303F20|nr:1-deoxy-D-xylulose-5-phosphate reductoisomerase [Dehalococcoides mccartyi]MCF7634784.1 1-deoxy-D-xylulose 5-phosphate reductoisomerase [Dehalococcoides mccartyi]MEA2121562.1 1-deoxy-D-xylulose 5-phosphate reductoisomerase [Dehalococcoides mccartyi]MEA2122975.1 1-deoxy-D-xylulose 5-phosphate reductoisomerase [Dehalococcoides mccartyi]
MVHSIKNIVILGSTGSIGRQTLEVIHSLPDRFKVLGLAGGTNTNLLKEQTEQFRPKYFYCQNCHDTNACTARFIPMEEMAALPEADIVVVATPGSAGLQPVLAAARAGKVIALANKESLVSAGEIVTATAQENRAKILPVDSEHSAIWQCLSGEVTPPARIILTASGGPFRSLTKDEIAKVTPEQALKHPSWKMGTKVTIDSASLMNKGLEIIEARWLFDMPVRNIQVVIHPQSIIHSMVEFADGSLKAQLSRPDMRFPIQCALTYPERLTNLTLPRLNWAEIGKLDFEMPDMDRFPCLKLAISAGEEGKTFPAALCAADEVAVEMFLKGEIGFGQIPELIAKVLDAHQAVASPSLDDILAADAWARHKVTELAGKL